MSQRETVLARLLESYPYGVSALSFLRENGIYRVGARIFELRQEGWDIETREERGKVGVYRLKSTTKFSGELGL